MPSPDVLHSLLVEQNGAVTYAQAYGLGLSRQQLRTLRAHGWTSPVRGVLVEPTPVDPFLAGLRAGMLASPDGVASHRSAARLHGLAGLPRWDARELPHLLLPAGVERAQRRGVRTSAGLRAGEAVVKEKFCVTTLSRTLHDLAASTELDEYICLLDSALHLGWTPIAPAYGRPRVILRLALSFADARSESPLETRLRLLLVRADLPPEQLQYRLFDATGYCFARLDFAWPSRKLAVEADGRGPHDKPDALYRDRVRQNDVGLAGWLVLRFTWFDVVHRPGMVIAAIRGALARRA